MNPSPGAGAQRRSPGPCPDTAATRGSSRTARDGSAWKMSFVPLPWWTSQSRISTRSTPCAARACAAATATLLKKQKPIARAASAWWPGRAQRRDAARLAVAEQRVDQRDGAAGAAERRLVGARRRRSCPCRSRRRRAPTAPRSKSTCSRGMHAAELLAGRRAAPRRRSQPNQSWRPSRPRARRSAPAVRGGRGPRARARRRDGTSGGTPVPYRSVQGPPSDLVVVGAGAAGLFASLTAARAGARVTLVSARPLAETASYWAQGGLAAALAVDDSPALHLEDTITAGRGLVRRSAAEVCARRRPPGSPTSRRSASASTPTATATSRSASRAATASAASSTPAGARPDGGSCASSPPTWSRRSGSRCSRAPRRRAAERGRAGPRRRLRRRPRDRRPRRDPRVGRRRRPVVADHRTRPAPTARGCCSRARRAPTLADLEFVQFHPTAVAGIRGREGFLVSEAVRGEGATLHDAAGERFVDELQPRDAVARAIAPPAGGDAASPRSSST